jgi:hypothetical protein
MITDQQPRSALSLIPGFFYERGWPSYFIAVRRGKNADVRGFQICDKSWRQTPAIARLPGAQYFKI